MALRRGCPEGLRPRSFHSKQSSGRSGLVPKAGQPWRSPLSGSALLGEVAFLPTANPTKQFDLREATWNGGGGEKEKKTINSKNRKLEKIGLDVQFLSVPVK